MSRQYDFTEGNLLKQIMFFSGPIMAANLLQASYQFADSLWVGNLLGTKALGSVAISATLIFTVLSFVIGLNNAALTILSQQKGRNDEAGLARYLNAFVVTLSVIAVIMGVLGIVFAEHLLRLLGTPKQMMQDAALYLRINFLGILFLIGYNFISTVLRALGDSRTPLRFIGLAVILNIVLDPLFISGFGMGVAGAALATVLSQGLAFGYGVYHLVSKRLVPFPKIHVPAKQDVGLILNLGIPSGLQMAVISAGIAAIMSVVASFGEPVVAGFGAAQRLDALLMIPAQALGVAASSMAGQNIGAGNWLRIRQLAVYSVLYNFIIMMAIGLLIRFLAPYAIGLFLEPGVAADFGTGYLQTIGLFYPFLGINFVLNGIVRASGAMYQVLALNVISLWLLRYPFAAVFSGWYGSDGIAYGMGASFLASSLFAFGYYCWGGWRKKELFKRMKTAGEGKRE